MEQIELIQYATQTLEKLEVSYALVGSWGSGVYGEPRFTRDVDIILDLDETRISQFCAAFPHDEFYISKEAVHEAVRTRSQFNVLHPDSGNKIDFILTQPDPWRSSQLGRRRTHQLRMGATHLDVFVAAPEDVILGKLWYFSEGGGERHLRDIVGILRVTGASLNRDLIEKWSGLLGVTEIWRQVVSQAESVRDPGSK